MINEGKMYELPTLDDCCPMPIEQPISSLVNDSSNVINDSLSLVTRLMERILGKCVKESNERRNKNIECLRDVLLIQNEDLNQLCGVLHRLCEEIGV